MAWGKKELSVPNVDEFFRVVSELPPVEGLKVGVYGVTGAGKTHFALTAPKPIFVIDTEFGARLPAENVGDKDGIYIFEALQLDEETMDVDPIGSLEKVEEALRAVIRYIQENKDQRGTIVLDSASDIWQWLGIWLEEDPGTKKKEDRILRFEWGKANKRYMLMIQKLLRSKWNIVLTGKVQEVFDVEGKPVLGRYKPRWQKDSVAEGSPVIVKRNGMIQIVPIETVKVGDTIWAGRWERVLRVHWHWVHEPLVRVITPDGFVDCTDNHSLVENGRRAYPYQCKKVDVVDWPVPDRICNGLDPQLAWLQGVWLADGTWHTPNAYVITAPTDELEVVRNVVSDYVRPHPIREYDYQCSQMTIPSKLAQKVLLSCRLEGSRKVVPPEVLNGSNEILRSFLDGFNFGDGEKGSKVIRIGQMDPVIATSLQYIGERLGYQVSVSHTNTGAWKLLFNKKRTKQSLPRGKVKKVIISPRQTLRAWDLTTSSHTWANGCLLVHNTEYWLDIVLKADIVYPQGKTKPVRQFTIVKCRAWNLSGTLTNPVWDDLVKFIEEKAKVKIL